MMKFLPGDLVELISAPDQNVFIRNVLCGKIGVVIEKVRTESSPNIYKILIEDRFYNLHALDMKLLQRNGTEQ